MHKIYQNFKPDLVELYNLCRTTNNNINNNIKLPQNKRNVNMHRVFCQVY